LDVDGVVNAWTPRWAKAQTVQIHVPREDRTLPVRIGLPILGFLRALAAHPNLTVDWATTWRDDAYRISEAFDLPEFYRLPDQPPLGEPWRTVFTDDSEGHYKGAGALDVMSKGAAALLWLDDEVATLSVARQFEDQFITPALLVQPDDSSGLTRADLDAASRFIARHTGVSLPQLCGVPQDEARGLDHCRESWTGEPAISGTPTSHYCRHLQIDAHDNHECWCAT